MKQQLKWNEMNKKQKTWFIIKSCLSLIMVIGILIFMVETVMFSCGYAKGAQKETASAATTEDTLYKVTQTKTTENSIGNLQQMKTEIQDNFILLNGKKIEGLQYKGNFGTVDFINITHSTIFRQLYIAVDNDNITQINQNTTFNYTGESITIYVGTENECEKFCDQWHAVTGQDLNKTIEIITPYSSLQDAYQKGYDDGLMAGQTATGEEGWILPAGGISFNGTLTGNTGNVYITRTQLGTLNKIFGSEYVIANTTFKIIGAEQGSEGINTPYWVSEKWNSQGQGASSVNSANIYIGQSSGDTTGVALTLVQRQIDSPPITISLKSFGSATALISDVPINFTQWKVNGEFLTKEEAQDMVQFCRDLGGTQLNLDCGTGYAQGYADGNAYGSETGYQNGYDAGYAEGEKAGESATNNFSFSWLINFASGLFGINVFGGFTLGDLVYTMLAIAIFGGILKLFFGG